MSTYASTVVPTHNIEQELVLLHAKYQTALTKDSPFEEVREILDKIRELQNELDRRKNNTSL